jgi:hypothetical protein
MKTTITLPLGARLAAERAYADMPRGRRSDPAHVAEVILIAAAPFMAPVVARMGRGRITETGAKDIFRYWLAGESTAELADRFAVTRRTITTYVRRGLVRARTRIAAGTSVATIAAENQVRPDVVRAAIAGWESRYAAA